MTQNNNLWTIPDYTNILSTFFYNPVLAQMYSAHTLRVSTKAKYCLNKNSV